jgi:tetratricopeptide (TPR) repeat protein
MKNKIKKYRVVVLGIMLLLFVPSCTDWLEIEPENDLIEDEYWTKTEDVEGVMAAMYDAFRESSLESLIWGELRGDMIQFRGTAMADYTRIAQSDITTTNAKINWKNYYKTINLANTLMYFSTQVLEKDKTFTERMKQSIDAEAIFLRSLSYFYLVRLWKDVPLVLNPTVSDTVDIFLSKSTEHEILNQIIGDLKVAKDMACTTEYIDDPPFYKGRANKYSIMALMADIYLWQEKYQECIDYCDSIINSNLFDLETYNTWFELYYPGNSMNESIFEIQYNSAYTSQENNIYNDVVRIGGSSNMRGTTNLQNIYTTDDIRKCSISDPDPSWKYIGRDLGGSTRIATEKDANFIYYRYAEILLFKAEAYIELSGIQAANEIIREIALRAGATFESSTDIDELRDYILQERAREFMAEGKRWFDILRYSKRDNFKRKQFIINMVLGNAGVKERQVLQTRVYDTMSYYLPIPENELIYNQNLVQNPFYDR